ncbi:methyl-accepting chemotaxis protein [Jeotgalibacillus sp. JSM ZJ347]|uniref:methyl-accepting chemotaxis protein n=1 Tax=Jeotgalibacillus sp. JSM ZJ347 TaxID=3342117 RepID=UPI0035A8AAEF
MKEHSSTGLMIIFNVITISIGFLVWGVHAYFNFNQTAAQLLRTSARSNTDMLIFYIVIALTLLFFVISLYFYKTARSNAKFGLFVTLSLTFGSMFIIAAGDGWVEYHFSIFMVIALISYFSSVSLILLSTVIFAVYHLSGYFLYPQLLCGTGDYAFGLLLIHAIFLILASAANIALVMNKNKAAKAYQLREKENQHYFQLIVSQLTDTVDDMQHTANNILSVSEDTKNVNQETALSLQGWHTDSNTLLLQNQQGLNELDHISDISDNLYQKGIEWTQLTALASKEVLSGQDYLNETSHHFDLVTSLSTEMADELSQFEREFSQISNFTTMIKSITDQTNLLALNASIEAARAGESGKGFSVVAAEVRKLAKESEDTATKIEQAIEKVLKSVRQIIASSQKERDYLEESSNKIVQTKGAFEQIQQTSLRIKNNVDQINMISERIVGQEKKLRDTLNLSIKSAHKGNNLSQELAAASEQQLAGAEESVDSSKKIEEMTGRLKKLTDKINQFSRQIDEVDLLNEGK